MTDMDHLKFALLFGLVINSRVISTFSRQVYSWDEGQTLLIIIPLI